MMPDNVQLRILRACFALCALLALAICSTFPLRVNADEVDPRDRRFPPWPTINPSQSWIGESRWLANQRALVLCGVLKDGPAGKAGLQADDTILSIGGKKIRDNGDLQKSLEEHAPGETVDFEIERDGQRRIVPVTFEAIPPDGGNGRILAAAEAGESWAMMDIGVRYSHMRGNLSYFEQNDAEAVHWFRRATESGYAAGPLFLAQMYQSGRGVGQDYAQAAKLYEQALKGKGDGVHKGLVGAAATSLAFLYLDGHGFSKDAAKAAQLFRQAADDGSLFAMYKLGGMHEAGQGVSKDLRAAMALYHSAAKEGYAPAELAVGMMAYEGRGVRVDYETARSWFEVAARHGNAEAMYMLGQMYENGQGNERDENQANEWYRKAAEKGYEKAKAKIAIVPTEPVASTVPATLDVFWITVPEGRLLWAVLPDGVGFQAGLRNLDIITQIDGVSAQKLTRNAGRPVVLKDLQPGAKVVVEYLRNGKLGTATVPLAPYPEDHSLARLETAAESQAPWAVHAVGLTHYLNAQSAKTPVEADREYAAAVLWFFNGSELKFAYSNKLLATLYEKGRGVKQDHEQALRYYELVRQANGDRLDRLAAAEAASELGLFALKSSPPDEKRAVALFREAAEAGLAAGQTNLAWAYEHGRGVAQNREEAIRWYRMCAAQGYPDAVKSLERLGAKP